jgi:hypothetical protein
MKFSPVVIWILRNFPPPILMLVSPDSFKGLIVFKNVSLTSLACPVNGDFLLGAQSPDQTHLAKPQVVRRRTTPHHLQ